MRSQTKLLNRICLKVHAIQIFSDLFIVRTFVHSPNSKYLQERKTININNFEPMAVYSYAFLFLTPTNNSNGFLKNPSLVSNRSWYSSNS